jgi:hypothetical protein
LKPEIKQEKEQAEKAIQEINEALELVLRAEWELNTQIRRLGLRNKGGRKP